MPRNRAGKMRRKAQKLRRVTVNGKTNTVIAEERTYLVVALASCRSCKGTGSCWRAQGVLDDVHQIGEYPCFCRASIPIPDGYDLVGMIQEAKEQCKVE